MLWVAFCHGACVVRFDPTRDKELHRVDLPCIETTACAFGGENLDRLFVTTGIKAGHNEPGEGQVFVIDGLDIKGVPAFAYHG
jgi:sugar lactone lactonase YvrE